MGVIFRIIQRFFKDLLRIDLPPSPKESATTWPEWTYGPEGPHPKNAPDTKLKILSLNCWTLPITPLCTERAREIATTFAQDWDLITFQEIWHCRERNILIAQAQKHGFVYYHYFQSAVGFPLPYGPTAFGTGLLVLSKFPISDATYYRYTLNGRVYALHEADYVAGKGVGFVRVLTPAGQIDVYVTHLLANYNYLGAPGPGDNYLAERAAQAYELSRVIETTSRNDLVVVCGDFNSPPDCLCVGLPMELCSLSDTFVDKNPSSDEGLTFGTIDNRFSHGDHPMRMDYVLYRIKPSSKWNLISSTVYKQFFKDSKGKLTPVSDHFGLAVEFKYGNPPSQKTLPGIDQPENEFERHDSVHSTGGCSVHGELDPEAYHIDINLLSNSTSYNLDHLLKTLLVGQQGAIARRQGHFIQAMITFILFVFIQLSAVMLDWVTLRSIATPFLCVYFVLQLIFAMLSVTWECGAVAELIAQVKLHQARINHSNKSLSSGKTGTTLSN